MVQACATALLLAILVLASAALPLAPAQALIDVEYSYDDLLEFSGEQGPQSAGGSTAELRQIGSGGSSQDPAERSPASAHAGPRRRVLVTASAPAAATGNSNIGVPSELMDNVTAVGGRPLLPLAKPLPGSDFLLVLPISTNRLHLARTHRIWTQPLGVQTVFVINATGDLLDKLNEAGVFARVTAPRPQV